MAPSDRDSNNSTERIQLILHLLPLLLYYNLRLLYEGHLESKERFDIKTYLLIIGKKTNMQVLSHTFTYST